MGYLCRIRNDFAIRVPADGFVRVLLAAPADGGADDTRGYVGGLAEARATVSYRLSTAS